MSKFRNKGGGTPEVHSARSKLDGVLQTLVEKKDTSPVPETFEDTDFTLDTSLLSPSKRSSASKQSRKRKRGRDDPDTPEMGQYHHTYVMKLFDRSVDLAQFDENTALYPVCRAWMRNQPHNRNLGPRERSPTPEPDATGSYSDEEDEFREIYKMSPPVPIKSEDGIDRDLRIPPLLSESEEDHLDIHADPASAPLPEQLLLNHLTKWKKIRQTWKDAARRNEARYAQSLQVLKDMFDRQCKDQ